MTSIPEFLQEQGPSRAGLVAEWLINEEGISPEAARKRLEIRRLAPSVKSFPAGLLPKGERFLYLQSQRQEEWFWPRFHQAMRDTKSVYGAAIDGLIARKGVVEQLEFAVCSGASLTGLKRQVMASSVADQLQKAGVIGQLEVDGKICWVTRRDALCTPDPVGFRSRQLTENILLDGLREWVRRMGFASFNQVFIRGEAERKPIGPYLFDLAGPSYLLPVKHAGKQPGFFVADVFVDSTITEDQVQYFLRKTSTLHGLLRKNGGGLLAALVADGFTSGALKAGHAAGILMTTPKDLYGRRVAASIQSLLLTLRDVAAYAAADSPDRITKLVADLADIEGASGNLRGILFELLAAYLARRNAKSIDMGVKATDRDSGKTADIDILAFSSQASHCVAIECKGRRPGGTVTLEEVQNWVRRLPVFTSHLRSQPHLRESQISYELWTSGTFEPDALSLLEKEKIRRGKHPVSWKDGAAILQLALEGKEKAIANTLREHFLKHALVIVVPQLPPDFSAVVREEKILGGTTPST